MKGPDIGSMRSNASFRRPVRHLDFGRSQAVADDREAVLLPEAPRRGLVVGQAGPTPKRGSRRLAWSAPHGPPGSNAEWRSACRKTRAPLEPGSHPGQNVRVLGGECEVRELARVSRVIV